LVGKISKIIIPINATTNNIIEYIYDAVGNRVAKYTRQSNSSMIQPTKQEYYIRDASGNILSTLERNNSYQNNTVYSDIIVTEQPIYGSSRIGVHYNGYKKCIVYPYLLVSSLQAPLPSSLISQRQLVYRKLDEKRYELSDHLGNVRTHFGDYLLSTISSTTPFTFTNLHAHQTTMFNYLAYVLKTSQGTRRSFYIPMRHKNREQPKPNSYNGSSITSQD
jgi:hypothetical protein